MHTSLGIKIKKDFSLHVCNNVPFKGNVTSSYTCTHGYLYIVVELE